MQFNNTTRSMDVASHFDHLMVYRGDLVALRRAYNMVAASTRRVDAILQEGPVTVPNWRLNRAMRTLDAANFHLALAMRSVTASLTKPVVITPLLPLARHSRFANIVTNECGLPFTRKSGSNPAPAENWDEQCASNNSTRKTEAAPDSAENWDAELDSNQKQQHNTISQDWNMCEENWD